MTTTINRPEILTRRQLYTPGRTGLGTLCLFRGPAPWIDATRRLSTPLWYGKNLLDQHGKDANAAFWDAGMLQRAIESEIGPCEHRPNVQHMREGVNWIDLRDETPAERYKRSVPDWFNRVQPFESHTMDPFRDLPTSQFVIGTKLLPDRQSLWISPSLHDEVGRYLSIDDFPELWTAGNGVTANTWLPLRNDPEHREVFVSWCVLDDAIVERLGHDPRMWEALRHLMESGETGAPYPVPLPPTPDCEHDWFNPMSNVPHFWACARCEAIRIGEHTVTFTSSYIEMQVATAPSAPASGYGRIYAAVDKQPLYLASDSTTTNMYATAASAAVTRVGGVTSEATTTSTTQTDVQTLSSISIASGTPYDIRTGIRKSSGNTFDGGLGLKLNSTTVGNAVTGATSAAIGVTGNTNNAAADGYCFAVMQAPETNYLNGSAGFWEGYESSGSTPSTPRLTQPNTTAPAANATITSIVLRGISGNALVTLGTKNLQVYSYASS